MSATIIQFPTEYVGTNPNGYTVSDYLAAQSELATARANYSRAILAGSHTIEEVSTLSREVEWLDERLTEVASALNVSRD